jgi:predicted Zn-dependent peptidase
LLAACVATASAAAQELTHPLEMGLPESRFERPDPADYSVRLDNGLVAYVARADQVPLANLSAFIGVGKVSDSPQGIAEALEAALKAGPADAAAGDFAAALGRMTAEITVAMHDEWTEVSLDVPVEDLAEAMDLFAAVLQSPSITDASIERAARAVGGDAADLGGESGPALYEGSLTAAVDRFHEILYDGHPYGARPAKSDFATLEAADVRDFHERYFVPGNIVLAVAGDIDTDALAAELEALFGGLAAGAVPEPIVQPPIAPMKRAQHGFEADKLQTWLVFGHALPRVPPEDEAALEVMNYILAGGHLWTRMTIETRYKYGYTNDASGFLEPHWYGPGSYTFRSYSRHEVIDDIYRNMMDEVTRIRSEPVDEEELFVAKGALTDGGFPVRYLDGYALSRAFALERLRHGNHERSASYVERIRAVDADDVLAAARKYLNPGQMQVVLMGRPVEL